MPGLGVGDACVAQCSGCLGDPVLENAGSGLTQCVVGAGYLQGDGRDGAGVGVTGVGQMLGGATEEFIDRAGVIWGTMRWGLLREYEVYEDTQASRALDHYLADHGGTPASAQASP